MLLSINYGTLVYEYNFNFATFHRIHGVFTRRVPLPLNEELESQVPLIVSIQAVAENIIC